MLTSRRSRQVIGFARTSWLLALLILCPISSAYPQPTLREIAIAESKAARDEARSKSLAETRETCGDRVRYDDEGLHLRVDQFTNLRFSGFLTLRDQIDFSKDGEFLTADSEIHLLKQCDERLGLYIVEVSLFEWSETVVVPMSGPPTYNRFVGAPLPSLDFNSIVFLREQGLGPRSRVEIALRDANGGWQKVWEYFPPDAYEWSFVRWEALNRFRLAMEGYFSSEETQHWDSVIEFTPTSFTRTDGTKTLVKTTR